MNQYLAEIRMFGGNFAPRGWALCQGQLLSISQNDALFALLGTTYGGNGVQTFGLPDFRGRRAVHNGAGPGLSTYYLGEKGGAETTVVTTSKMPVHSHPITGSISVTANIMASSNDPDAATPVGASFCVAEENIYATPGDANFGAPVVATSFSAMSLATNGGSQPIEILSPYQVVNFIICTEGIFPSRN